jgi:uncharacterized protein DUF3226
MASYYCDNFDLTKKPATTHLFLAEGEAEVGFIDEYLKTRNPGLKETTILCFKGLGNVRDKTDTLAKLIEKGPSGLDQLRGIGVMGDAETNPSGQLDVAIQIATSLGFSRPAKDIRDTQQCERNGRRFGVALSPSHQVEGRIENLILQGISGDPFFQCLELAFGCIEGVSDSSVDAKAQVQMFISAKANSSLAGIRHAFHTGIFNPSAQPYSTARSMIDYISRGKLRPEVWTLGTGLHFCSV